jgi:uncharacterized membrane protein
VKPTPARYAKSFPTQTGWREVTVRPRIAPVEPTPVYGPARRTPEYYIGALGEPYLKADAERYGNGVLAGHRDKPARRAIRKLLRKSVSTIDKKIIEARRARIGDERLTSNSHEAKRFSTAMRKDRRNERVVSRNAKSQADALAEFARR